MSNESGDNPELESLFDSIAYGVETPPPIEGEARPVADEEDVYSRLGHLARQLYDTLGQLGYDQALEKTVHEDLPDTRQRLDYIAEMTEKAAMRTLNAVDSAQPVLDQVQARSRELGDRWQAVFDNRVGVDEFRQLALDTRAHLSHDVPGQIQIAGRQLNEIMLAQDFQDLTGQVIKKLVEMSQRLEGDMLQLLVAAMPADKRKDIDQGLLNGPVVNPEGRGDVVTSQEQVDELLASLGF